MWTESRTMSKEIYISSTPHETRLAIVEKDELTEIYYERENEYTLAGSIYNGRVTRVLPGMQSSFVDIGLERDAFLYITDFMEEAGDAADFGGIAGGEARAPRTDRPRVEGEGRGEGRGRGRGRRDGRDGRPREAQPEVRGEGSVDEEQGSLEPEFVAVDDEVLPRESEGEEIGEGAPGADGSRRWRGRRGRRRGRGVAGEAGVEATETSAVAEDVVEAAPEEVRAPRIVEGRSSEGRGPREGRERGGRDRGGRERGGRDRDRGERPAPARDNRRVGMRLLI
jgi:ribonuclease E